MRNRSALQFVLIIGIVNFFADFTYEGARGIVGPFLGSLGASAAVLGFVAGLGELMGYALRSVSGYFADKLHRHWVFAFLGYASAAAVPVLAVIRLVKIGENALEYSIAETSRHALYLAASRVEKYEGVCRVWSELRPRNRLPPAQGPRPHPGSGCARLTD